MALADYTRTIDHTSGVLQADLGLEADEILVSINIDKDSIPEQGILVFTSKAGSSLIPECNKACLPPRKHVNIVKDCHCSKETPKGYNPCGCKPPVRPIVKQACKIEVGDCCTEDNQFFEMVAYDGFYKCDNCEHLFLFYGLTRGLPYYECSIERVEENVKEHECGEQVLVCPTTHFNFCEGDLPKSPCETVRSCLSSRPCPRFGSG